MKVMAAAEKEALEYLYETKNGKMLLKKLTKEVYDENNQECRAEYTRGEGRVAESKKQWNKAKGLCPSLLRLPT